MSNDLEKLLRNLETERTTLLKRIKDLEAQHKDLVERNAFLRKRPDLPVDRISTHHKLSKRIRELEGDLNIVKLQRDAAQYYNDEEDLGR